MPKGFPVAANQRCRRTRTNPCRAPCHTTGSPILSPRTFPDFPDHVRVGLGKCAVAHPGADQRLWVVGATHRIVDHSIGDAVQASQAATAAAVAASSFAFGTKFPAATMTTCGQRSAGRKRCQLIAGQPEKIPS